MDDKRKFSQHEKIWEKSGHLVAQGTYYLGWNRAVVVDGLSILPPRSIQGQLTTFSSLYPELVSCLSQQTRGKTSSTIRMPWRADLVSTLYLHLFSYCTNFNNAIVLSWTGSFVIFNGQFPFFEASARRLPPWLEESVSTLEATFLNISIRISSWCMAAQNLFSLGTISVDFDSRPSNLTYNN